MSRGEVTLWPEEAVLDGWRAVGGKGMRYRDAAILCALSLRAACKLPLRQTQGFLHSLKAMPGLTIPVPHCSTLARRAADLAVPNLKRGPQNGPLHLAIDLGRPQALRRGGMADAPAWPPKFFAPNAPRHGFSDQWRSHGSTGCHAASGG